jgi:hypothetical protein
MTKLLVPGSIIDRLWVSFIEMTTGRIQSSAPTTVTLLQQAEKIFLGPTDDLALSPVVQDVFNAMRVAGLILLAFCTVISLAEFAETSITGQGSSLVSWFKRFFVATLMTFGGLQVYSLWIRLFNGMLSAFRGYLDTHWTEKSDLSVLFSQVVSHFSEVSYILVLVFVVLVVVVLFVLWFMVGGVRQAELILSMVIAPVVWPLYLIPSVEDIPKTALRGFLGLNAVLLFTVAMVRISVRLAIGNDGAVSIWNLVPALAMLVMTIFLPATIKRIVGQGQSGVGALVTAVQMAAGLKFLALGGMGAAGGGAAAAPAAAAVPAAPAGPSAYPLATVPPAGMAGYSAHGGTSSASPQAVRAFLGGTEAMRPLGLGEPIPASRMVMDISESEPGSGQFDTLTAFRRYDEGVRGFRKMNQDESSDSGGEQ